MKRTDTVDFEIAFFEGVVRNKPDFIEALIALGELYTQKKEYDKGLEVDETLARLRPHDPLILYNLACSYSLTNSLEKSFAVIKKAIACGYEDIAYLEQDSDLISLRSTERFQRYLGRLKKRKVTAV